MIYINTDQLRSGCCAGVTDAEIAIYDGLEQAYINLLGNLAEIDSAGTGANTFYCDTLAEWDIVATFPDFWEAYQEAQI